MDAEEQVRRPHSHMGRTPTGMSQGVISGEGFCLPPQHNLLAETGRLDSVHVVERLHPNGTRLYCAGYNP